MYQDVECPYCGEWQEINHDDGYGYEEGVVYNQECSNCDKYFAYTTSISFYYEADKAACLNGGDHEWKLTSTFPREYTQMYCSMCGKHRSLNDQERQDHNIPPIKELHL